ncbi:ISL3 family transposase [Streptomyces sp. NPDC003032]
MSSDGCVVRVDARAREVARPCPDCGANSVRVHSWYERSLDDVPVGGRSVVVQLSVRRLYCDAVECRRRSFAEQIDGLTAPYGRRTAILAGMLHEIALALAGRAGARLAAELHVTVSRTTSLSMLVALPDPPLLEPRVPGIDDFATKRGRKYGTVLVDAESRKVVDLLPGREKELVASRLSEHPGVEIICRDRAGGYAEAANAGAPQA